MPRSLTPAELGALTARTIGDYDGSADAFRAGTWDHDVSQNRAALLGAIAGSSTGSVGRGCVAPVNDPPPFHLLDFGCGPGRDLVYFASLGHHVVGLDGSARFVAMARAAAPAGCQDRFEVWHQDFLALTLPPARFHGVFANASLFHVPGQELSRVLGQLRDTLVPGGVLFSSNPRGQDDEGFHHDRYGAFHSLESWRAQVSAAGFVELDHFYRPPGRPCAQQPWLATVWRKPLR